MCTLVNVCMYRMYSWMCVALCVIMSKLFPQTVCDKFPFFEVTFCSFTAVLHQQYANRQSLIMVRTLCKMIFTIVYAHYWYFSVTHCFGLQIHRAFTTPQSHRLQRPDNLDRSESCILFYLFLWMLCRAGQKSGFSSPHFYISSVHHRYKNLQPVRAAAPPCLAHAFYKISNNHIINRCMLKVISIYKYILWSLLYKRFFVYLQHNIYKMVLNS